eukprot:RCo008346
MPKPGDGVVPGQHEPHLLLALRRDLKGGAQCSTDGFPAPRWGWVHHAGEPSFLAEGLPEVSPRLARDKPAAKAHADSGVLLQPNEKAEGVTVATGRVGVLTVGQKNRIQHFVRDPGVMMPSPLSEFRRDSVLKGEHQGDVHGLGGDVLHIPGEHADGEAAHFVVVWDDRRHLSTSDYEATYSGTRIMIHCPSAGKKSMIYSLCVGAKPVPGTELITTPNSQLPSSSKRWEEADGRRRTSAGGRFGTTPNMEGIGSNGLANHKSRGKSMTNAPAVEESPPSPADGTAAQAPARDTTLRGMRPVMKGVKKRHSARTTLLHAVTCQSKTR